MIPLILAFAAGGLFGILVTAPWLIALARRLERQRAVAEHLRLVMRSAALGKPVTGGPRGQAR